MALTAISSASSNIGHREILGTICDEITAIRNTLGAILVGQETYDPASLSDAAGATSTGATVTGAALGDFCIGSCSLDLQGITTTHYVDATNSCKTRFQNESGGTLDIASLTIRYFVIPKGAVALLAQALTKT